MAGPLAGRLSDPTPEPPDWVLGIALTIFALVFCLISGAIIAPLI